MAVHRTKEQKRKAELRRQEMQEVPAFQYKAGATTKKASSRPSQFHRDQEQFLAKDLLHSFVVSAIMICCFVGIYAYLRYNDMTLVSVLF